MISFVYFCSTSCLRCHQVACISFSILHSISWEEGTTILSVPSIDRLLGCSLFIAIMTNAAINILICVFWCTCTDSSTGNMSRSGFLSWKRDICSGFQITGKYFPKGFTLTVCEHSNESGARGQPVSALYALPKQTCSNGSSVRAGNVSLGHGCSSGWLEKGKRKKTQE